MIKANENIADGVKKVADGVKKVADHLTKSPNELSGEMQKPKDLEQALEFNEKYKDEYPNDEIIKEFIKSATIDQLNPWDNGTHYNILHPHPVEFQIFLKRQDAPSIKKFLEEAEAGVIYIGPLPAPSFKSFIEAIWENK